MVYKFNRPDSGDKDVRFETPTTDEILDHLDEIRLWAERVIRRLKPSPGGDVYEYTGNMDSVEELRDAVDNYHGLWYRVRANG